jgi:hypothetical protein
MDAEYGPPTAEDERWAWRVLGVEAAHGGAHSPAKEMNTMAESEPRSLTARADQPLIAIPVDEDGREMVRYFIDEEAADEALGDTGVQQALSLAGAWKDIDTPDALDILDRIRHESKPTPPIEEL